MRALPCMTLAKSPSQDLYGWNLILPLGRNCASPSLPAMVGCTADAMPASCLFTATLVPITAWSLVRGNRSESAVGSGK